MTYISITRALSELKRYDSRITAAIVEGTYAVVMVGKGQHAKFENSIAKSKEEVEEKIQSSYDKVDALIKNRQSLKNAIVKSNAETTVKILDSYYSVAEAIELRGQAHILETYLNKVRQSLAVADQAAQTKNTSMVTEIDKQLTTLLGSDKNSRNNEDVQLLIDRQKNLKEAEVIAGCTRTRIEEMQEKLSKFTTEIDFALSESNAKTTIAVDYL